MLRFFLQDILDNELRWVLNLRVDSIARGSKQPRLGRLSRPLALGAR